MDKRPKNRKDYDGVIYEPSNYTEQRRRSAPPRKDTRKVRHKSQFTLFYILTLVAAVTLCIVIFLVVFDVATKKNTSPPPVADGPPEPQVTTEAPVAIEETTQLVGVIQETVPATGAVKLFDIDSEKISTLTTDPRTSLTSRYGQSLVFSEFRPGDIVEVTFNTKTNVLRSMSHSGDAWEYRQVKDIKIDVVEQSLVYGNDTYRFGKNFLVSYKGEPYDVAGIKPIDICTIRGYKDTVWSIEVIKSHGRLEIIGKDDIVEGLLELNTDVFTMLNAFETLDVLEGEHRLVIKGANVEPYVKDIVIVPGETTSVDIADAQRKSGVLRMNVNESFYTLTVDGEITPTNEPIVLKYGTYEITVEKDEFESWEGTVEINAPIVDVNVTLQQIFKLARLRISTSPSGAEIYVDGSHYGKSPVEVPVEMGEHTVRAELEGYLDMPYTAMVITPIHEMGITLQLRSETLPVD